MFSSNYTLYGDMSDRVMKTLASFVSDIEIYSIDEAFLDMSNMQLTDLQQLGETIRETIKRNVGIPVTVGIGATKTLAKMANRYAKKNLKEKGVFYAASAGDIDAMLTFTEVGDIWGIGHQYALLLRRHGFHTAFDLRAASPEWVRKNLTVMGERLLKELNGIPAIAWEEAPKARKNICNAKSFGTLLTDREEIKEALCNYAANISQKLREQNTCARSLQVFVQTNPHKREHQQYLRSVIVHLPRPSNLAGDLISNGIKGFDLIFKEGLSYMKCGMIALDIVPENQAQNSLFDQSDRTGPKRLFKAVDSINKLIGRDVVRMAVQGYERKYRMRADHLSKRYTTDINQLLKVMI